MDILRAGIEALNDGSVVLPAPEEVRQPFDVRQNMSDSVLEARITEIVQRQTEPLFAEKFAAIEERLEKLSAWVMVVTMNHSGSNWNKLKSN